MSEIIYILCALTSFACAWLLLQSYRSSGHRLLFWSGLCFSVMTVNNLVLVIDKLVLPDANLLLIRHLSALAAVVMLLYGLIYEKD
ncbi:hypothetical protein KY495_17960 [Massilia sp. PAMC28688]|uniref:DUF5985 family protein n=1 Tax=Massilia sp. PAMC28688 TaxID=2861283 RepID=UPI001C636D25|nr:DUF5985 family protein [Massilia sp. PAMC28688]QYF92608.1 hypothetical protein KY495_17960 [Massilia sp. PAMC28688]